KKRAEPEKQLWEHCQGEPAGSQLRFFLSATTASLLEAVGDRVYVHPEKLALYQHPRGRHVGGFLSAGGDESPVWFQNPAAYLADAGHPHFYVFGGGAYPDLPVRGFAGASGKGCPCRSAGGQHSCTQLGVFMVEIHGPAEDAGLAAVPGHDRG